MVNGDLCAVLDKTVEKLIPNTERNVSETEFLGGNTWNICSRENRIGMSELIMRNRVDRERIRINVDGRSIATEDVETVQIVDVDESVLNLTVDHDIIDRANCAVRVKDYKVVQTWIESANDSPGLGRQQVDDIGGRTKSVGTVDNQSIRIKRGTVTLTGCDRPVGVDVGVFLKQNGSTDQLTGTGIVRHQSSVLEDDSRSWKVEVNSVIQERHARAKTKLVGSKGDGVRLKNLAGIRVQLLQFIVR